MYSYNYTDATYKDKPTSYDGKSIAYDSNGNMTNFNGWTYTWSGKNLSSSTNGTNNVSYEYTTDGFRTHKTVNGVTTTYILNGNNNITSETNGQGDIIGLLDSSNTEVVAYRYDSWGKLLNISGSLASTVGAKNPFHYRSYYYDTETGLYYLQSRYYNPEINRFISKDDASYHESETEVNGNLYAYANDNPVMNVDPSGYSMVREDSLAYGIDSLISLFSFGMSVKIFIMALRSHPTKYLGRIYIGTRKVMSRFGVKLRLSDLAIGQFNSQVLRVLNYSLGQAIVCVLRRFLMLCGRKKA